MLYNGVFGCHGNTCYVVFIGAFFLMIHSIGPINVCTDFETNRYKIDEFRKYAKIVFYLMSRGAKMTRRSSLGLDTSENILKLTKSLYDFRFKSYGSNSGFHVFGDLDIDI